MNAADIFSLIMTSANISVIKMNHTRVITSKKAWKPERIIRDAMLFYWCVISETEAYTVPAIRKKR